MIPVTYIIIGITCVVSFIGFQNRDLLNKFLFNAYQVAHRKEYWRLFSNGLIHGGIMHLLMNMYVLYLFGISGGANFQRDQLLLGVEGTFLEDFGFRGIIYYIVLYIGGLFVSSLPSLMKHGNNPSYNSLGASGATSAVLFSCILLNPTLSLSFIFFPFFPIPAVVLGILYLWYEHYMGKKGGTGIAHDAHIGGAVFGILFTIFIHPQYAKEFVTEISELINFIAA